MKQSMTKLVSLSLFSLALSVASAQAAPGISASNTEYKMFFTSSDGKVISNEQALLAAMKGVSVYKCQSVEAKLNKSGSSISVRNVKKPHVAKAND